VNAGGEEKEHALTVVEKIVLLVKKFGSFSSVRELATVIYICDSLEKTFGYPQENFVFDSLDGAESIDVNWDIVDLSRRGILSVKSPVRLAKKGEEIARKLTGNQFCPLASELGNVDRRLLPLIATYLYTCEYYLNDLEKVRQALKRGYNISEEELRLVEPILKKIRTT
jgi:hypothetical protein